MDSVCLDSLPLSDLKPYDVYELQAEYQCYSPREAYIQLCGQMDCRPSRAVAAMLPAEPGSWDRVQYIDLSRSYVGPKGVLPVVELCKRLPSLRRLSLAANYLQNDCLWYVAQLALYHPSLAEIDLSDNEFVSWSGAMCLATAVVQNPRLTSVNLLRTAVEPATAEAVFYHTRKNAVAMAVATRRVAPSPSMHVSAIHLRAIRRFFDSIKDPATGCVDRDGIAAGYRERLHLLGRSEALAGCDDAFFEELRARAPSDRVTWEMFLLLAVLDAVEYADQLVAALRRIFKEFNINAAPMLDRMAQLGGPDGASALPPAPALPARSSALAQGFVEADAFPAVYVRLYGTNPGAKELESIAGTLGLQAGVHTVNWDEFLYTWYCKGPTPGSLVIGAKLTDLPREVRPFHY